MSAEITGQERTLRDVLGGDYAFVIPRYQRPYRWQPENALELLDDLLTASAGTGGLKDLDPYFLGSIVLVKPRGETRAEVLDGQQRLTTITVLLAALRAHCSAAFGDALTAYLYTEEDVLADIEAHYRLRLRKDDQVFFEHAVLTPGAFEKLESAEAKTETQRNLRANAIALAARVSEIAAEDITRVERLAKFMIQRCFLVVVSTQSFDSAYRVFSVLNDRGMDLSPTDILKADLIGEIPAKHKERYSDIWEELEERFGPTDFVNLFAHVRMAVSRTKVTVSLLKHYRSDILPGLDPAQFIDETVVPYARAFAELRDADIDLGLVAGSAEVRPKLSALLVALGHIDHGEWVPPALLGIERYRTEPESLLRFFTRLERLAAAQMICRVRRDQRITRYMEVLKWLEGGPPADQGNAALDLGADEVAAVRSWLDGPVYGQKPARMVLLRLDGLIAGTGARYSYSTLSIEHVLPQTPATISQWRDDFRDSEREQLVHQIGNLVLLARRKNSHARNYDFAKKKKRYFSPKGGGVSPFALTNLVLAHDVWTPKVIRKRQAELVELLVKAWQL